MFRGMEHMLYEHRLEHQLCSAALRARIRDGRFFQQRKFHLAQEQSAMEMRILLGICKTGQDPEQPDLVSRAVLELDEVASRDPFQPDFFLHFCLLQMPRAFLMYCLT